MAEVAVNTASINGVASTGLRCKRKGQKNGSRDNNEEKPPRIILAGVSDHTLLSNHIIVLAPEFDIIYYCLLII